MTWSDHHKTADHVLDQNSEHIPCFVPDRSPHVTALEGESADISGVRGGTGGIAGGVPRGSALQHIRQASQGSLSHRFLRTLRLTVQVRPAHGMWLDLGNLIRDEGHKKG